MISVSSTAEMLEALRTAREVTFSAYLLRPGPVADGLKQAARRGADVQVRADGNLYGDCAARTPESRKVLRELRTAGVHALFVHCGKDGGPGLHMKAVVCDGVAFLDDCNWGRGGDTIVRDDTPSHVRAIREAALRRDARSIGVLAMNKFDALGAEARVLHGRRHVREIDVETEDLGGSPASHALRALIAKGIACRVLVSERAFNTYPGTHKAALSLRKAGADVRTVPASEKIAIAGSRAWIGSANATSTHYNGRDVDWSLTCKNAAVVRALKHRFNAHWRESAALQVLKS